MRGEIVNLKSRRVPHFMGLLCRLAASLFFVVFAASDPVSATGKPAAEESVNGCYKSTNPVIAVALCTQAIESGRLSGKGLAFALYACGNVYNE
jgi:hypothetical protein